MKSCRLHIYMAISFLFYEIIFVFPVHGTVCGMTERLECLDLSLRREILEEEDSLKYLGSIVSKNGDVVED